MVNLMNKYINQYKGGWKLNEQTLINKGWMVNLMNKHI